MTESGDDTMAGRWAIRRTVYLLIGGAVALAFLMLGSVLASPVQGETVTDMRLPVVVALALMIGVGLLPGIREVQVAAAQTLLGVDDVTVPEPLQWRHRWRTALWTFVHQAVGALAGVAMAASALLVGGIIAFAGGQDRIDVLVRIERPDTSNGWLLLGGAAVAVLVAAVVIVVGGGWGARWSAPLLLGSSGADRLAAAERRLRREQEYGRLSRDLHDGVGHSLSAISLQAVAGERVVRRDPDKAAAALSTIQSLAADAVAELDQVLGMLRAGTGDGAAPTHPEPTLADLSALAARHREMGMTLDLDIALGVDVPGPLSRLAYRICAEALSNAAKHAGPGAVTLRVATQDGDVVVTGRNPLGAGPEGGRAGHGLAGLTESVAVFGGTLSAEPAGSAWVLEARLPMRGARG